MKLSYEFTPRILEHILGWGSKLCRDNKKCWTEWDAKIYFLIYTEAKKMRHERYIFKKNAKKRGPTSPVEHFQGIMIPGK